MKHFLSILIVCGVLLVAHSTPKAQLAKQVYFAPYDTVTIDGEQRFRARCYGLAGEKTIDLRPDGGATNNGAALCISDSLPSDMTGVLSIASALDGSVSPAVKGLIRAKIGVVNVNELTATTFDQLVFQLLIDLPKAKGGLWKPLQPAKDGKYHIHLGQEFQQTAWLYPHILDGGLVADASNAALSIIEPAMAWAASFTENWTCPDNSSLACTLAWTKVTGTGCAIVSNQASCSGNQTTQAREDSDTSTSDVTAQYTLVSATKGGGTSTTASVLARQDSSGAATYYACESIIDTNLSHALYKRVAGLRTDLTTNTTDPVNGDVIKITANGSSISCDRNGSALMGPSTDTAITTGTRGGFRYAGLDVAAALVLDDFIIADIGGAAPRKKHAPIFFQ